MDVGKPMKLREHMNLLDKLNAEYHKETEPLLLAKQQIERQKKTNKESSQ